MKKVLFLILVMISSSAFAQSLGGLNTATSTATEVQNGIYMLVGAISGIVLLYYGVSAWFEKKTWTDFAYAVMGVAAVGGSIPLATWAWSLFA